MKDAILRWYFISHRRGAAQRSGPSRFYLFFHQNKKLNAAAERNSKRLTRERESVSKCIFSIHKQFQGLIYVAALRIGREMELNASGYRFHMAGGSNPSPVYSFNPTRAHPDLWDRIPSCCIHNKWKPSEYIEEWTNVLARFYPWMYNTKCIQKNNKHKHTL